MHRHDEFETQTPGSLSDLEIEQRRQRGLVWSKERMRWVSQAEHEHIKAEGFVSRAMVLVLVALLVCGYLLAGVVGGVVGLLAGGLLWFRFPRQFRAFTTHLIVILGLLALAGIAYAVFMNSSTDDELPAQTNPAEWPSR